MAIPVLMYHSIVNEKTNGLHRTIISKKQFQAQIDWLHSNGYESISPYQAYSILKNKQDCSKKIVLTFDDGYKSYFDIALPILSSAGYRATLFLTTSFVDQQKYPTQIISNNKLHEYDRPLNTNELKDLINAKWHIENHTNSHISLYKQTNKIIELELNSSNIYIKNKIGFTPKSFAYPYGAYDSKSFKVVQMKFEMAFTTHPGLWKITDALHRIPRIEINNELEINEFVDHIHGKKETMISNFKSLIRSNMKLYDFIRKFIALK
jgi:peptidoglycan/xylan/chitin deacetylase (PgdA/CDA1 family)